VARATGDGVRHIREGIEAVIVEEGDVPCDPAELGRVLAAPGRGIIADENRCVASAR
jgi:hypothetical protein